MRFNLDLKDIKYVKVLYMDEFGDFISVKTALKSINEREIIVCGKYDEDCNIEFPQTVVLSIVCGDGLYKTKTRLKSVENAEPYLIFILEVPDGVEYEQNREYFRICEKFPCIYNVETEDDDVTIEAETYDISANGVSVIMPSLVVSDGYADLAIGMPNRKVDIRVAYVRSEKVPAGYKVSFTFAKISETDRDCISQFCIKKQLEQKRSYYY